jgi:hypothetical protein
VDSSGKSECNSKARRLLASQIGSGPATRQVAAVTGIALVVAVVLLAAMPGILLKLDLAAGLANPACGGFRRSTVSSASFGSGLRFWLGLAARRCCCRCSIRCARCMLARFIGVGTVRSACGLWSVGPLLVLYHATWLGSTP